MFMKTVFASFSAISYFLMGAVQLFAIWAFLTDYWHWPSMLAGIAGLFLAGMPVVGSICGFIGAYVVWDWEWWQVALLFFWWPVLMLCLSAFGVGTEFLLNLSSAKRACVIILLVGAIGGLGWLATNNKAETDWLAADIRVSSQKKFATDFVHALKMSPIVTQGELTLAIYEIYFLNQSTGGVDPFAGLQNEEEVFIETLKFLFREGQKTGTFSLASLLRIRDALAKQHTDAADRFNTSYGPYLRTMIQARIADATVQNQEAEMLRRLKSTQQLARDLAE